MDYFAVIEKKIEELKTEIIRYIRKVLIEEKCYKVGDRAIFYDEIDHHEYAFEIQSDIIMYGENYQGDTYYYHARNLQWMDVDELKRLLHEAYHTHYNYKH